MSLSDAFGEGGFDFDDEATSSSSSSSGNTAATAAAMDQARRTSRLHGRTQVTAAQYARDSQHPLRVVQKQWFDAALTPNSPPLVAPSHAIPSPDVVATMTVSPHWSLGQSRFWPTVLDMTKVKEPKKRKEFSDEMKDERNMLMNRASHAFALHKWDACLPALLCIYDNPNHMTSMADEQKYGPLPFIVLCPFMCAH